MKNYTFAALSALLCLLLLAGCGTEQPADAPTPPVSSVSDGGGVMPDTPEVPDELGQPPAPEVPDESEIPEGPEIPAPSEDPSGPLVHYRGSLNSYNTGGRYLPDRRSMDYDIQLYGEEGDDRFRYVSITFTSRWDGAVQTFLHDIEEHRSISSLREGLMVLDIDQNGADDIYLDLGISGRMRLALCYVYDAQLHEMVPVNGFESLWSPILSYEPTGELVVIAWDSIGMEQTPDGYDEGLSKYRVEGDQLVLLSTARYNYGNTGDRYTVTDYTSGDPVLVGEDLTVAEFQRFNWYGIRLT